jgi:hypothetical protein
LNFSSDGVPSQRAWAPVARMTVSARYTSPLSQLRRNGRWTSSSLVTRSVTIFHLLHQPRALDDVGETRIILHIGGDGELAAGLDALDQDRFKHRARGINRSRVAGGSGTDDDDLGVDGGRHGADRSLEGTWSALEQNTPGNASRRRRMGRIQV